MRDEEAGRAQKLMGGLWGSISVGMVDLMGNGETQTVSEQKSPHFACLDLKHFRTYLYLFSCAVLVLPIMLTEILLGTWETHQFPNAESLRPGGRPRGCWD